MLYDAIANFKTATKYYEKISQLSLNQAYANLPEFHRRYGQNLQCLGFYEKAKEHFKKALKLSKEICEKENSDLNNELYAIDYGNLARNSFSLGNYKKSLNYGKQALAINKKFLNENHPRVAVIHNIQGRNYLALRKYDKASYHHNEELKIAEQRYSNSKSNHKKERHVGFSSAYSGLGQIEYELIQFQKAKKHHEKALKINKNLYGEQHPSVAIDYCNLGEVWNKLDDSEQAVKCYEKALNIFNEIYKDNQKHPVLVKVLNSLESINKNQKVKTGKTSASLDDTELDSLASSVVLDQLEKDSLEKQKHQFGFWKQSTAKSTEVEIIETKPAKTTQYLVEVAAKKGYECDEVPADGNCQFHAIVAQLRLVKTPLKPRNLSDLSTLSHQDLRALAVKVIEHHKTTYASFLTEPIEHYIRRMSQLGEWGDQCTLDALSRALGVNIRLIHAEGNELYFPEPPTINTSTLAIGYNGTHYWSLKINPEVTTSSSLTSLSNNPTSFLPLPSQAEIKEYYEEQLKQKGKEKVRDNEVDEIELMSDEKEYHLTL